MKTLPLLAAQGESSALPAIIAIVFILVGLVILAMVFNVIGIWLRAAISSAKVSLWSLVGMKFRRVPPALIVDARIRLVKAGISIPTDLLEGHFLAGGDVLNVVNALIAADKAGIRLDFKKATAIDLAGRDVLEAVRTSVNPKVIDCPAPKSGTGGIGMLDAVAKDGIRLLVKARVTVRANIDRSARRTPTRTCSRTRTASRRACSRRVSTRRPASRSSRSTSRTSRSPA